MPGRHRRGRGQGRAGGGPIWRFIEPVLLLLLHQGPGHGYELVNALEPFGLGDMAPGPVYRTLRELEVAGLVRSEWDTESSAGPARRIYHLTEAGHHHLAGWAKDLSHTEGVLRHFLAAYERHMAEGSGEHH